MQAHTMISSGGAAQGPGSWSLGLRSWPGIGCQFVFFAHVPKPGLWSLRVELKVVPLLYSCVSVQVSWTLGKESMFIY